jgi:hypothetical protein
MKPLNFLIFPYRDFYFQRRYGATVRDLHIINALSQSELVKSIHVVNRPVSVYERLYLKRAFPVNDSASKISWIDRTSWDLHGPLSRRKWLVAVYDQYVGLHWRQEDCFNVLMDFTPLSLINYQQFNSDFVWYDLIDNFAKHNRYDTAERRAVRRKYERIANVADLVTGVTTAAIEQFPNGRVVRNGVGVSRHDIRVTSHSPAAPFDFGFLGFLTDKFDSDTVLAMAAHGFKIGIYGDFYDKSLRHRLIHRNITLCGSFRDGDVPKIMGTFRVGLIPYKKDKLHDGSPLKLYQYLAYGHPVISSVLFDDNPLEFVVIYEGIPIPELMSQAEQLLASYDVSSHRAQIAAQISDDDFWDAKIDRLLREVSRRCDAS